MCLFSYSYIPFALKPDIKVICCIIWVSASGLKSLKKKPAYKNICTYIEGLQHLESFVEGVLEEKRDRESRLLRELTSRESKTRESSWPVSAL